MASSEDRRDWTASPKDTGLETDLETSSGGKLARQQKTIPTAHLTFVIDCARGKQLSLAAPAVPSRAPSPSQGPVTPPMKTYILFCGENQPHLAQETPVGRGHLAQARDTLPPCRGIEVPASFLASSLCPQEVPEANGKPLKAVPARSLTWGTVKGSLKVLSYCIYGKAN